MRQLQIPGHVHVCRDGDFVVMLDVRRDRYWALEAERTAALSSIVAGWPAAPSAKPTRSNFSGTDATDVGAAGVNVTEAVQMLIDNGLLSDVPGDGTPATGDRRDPTPDSDVLPQHELLADGAEAAVGATNVVRFVVAATTAATLLRCFPFARAIERVRRRKADRDACNDDAELTRSATLVAAFATLQPVLFSRRDACLFNSLALIEFLAAHAVYPEWVFGVQGRPFAAHCWVQKHGVLLNDTLDHVRRYTPIMVV